jgi:hypothetical protein
MHGAVIAQGADNKDIREQVEDKFRLIFCNVKAVTERGVEKAPGDGN